jgi:plasmid maintenance system killer protein
MVFLPLLLFSCQNESPNTATYGNPPADGFNAKDSDSAAIALADEVMEAMGGRKNWDNTEFLVWNFFDSRKHYWNKKTGDIRIESMKDSIIYLLNIHSMKGQVKINDTVQTEPDSLKKLLINGKSMWINDAYWLVMPFKLKDSGVTLKMLEPATTEDGKPADVLELTFTNVGDTPNNKYQVFVDKETKLVSQWSFFGSAEDVDPLFTMPWTDYKKQGNLLLSGNRGRMKLTEIAAPATLDAKLFTDF